MKVFYNQKAQRALEHIVNFIESKNTLGSSKRFALKFESIINKYALENVEHAKCNDVILAELDYSCITIQKWVVAFKIKQNKFIVYRIIWGGLLK